MRSYQIFITLANGRYAVMTGMFLTDWAAIAMAQLVYEEEGVLAAVPRRKEL